MTKARNSTLQLWLSSDGETYYNHPTEGEPVLCDAYVEMALGNNPESLWLYIDIGHGSLPIPEPNEYRIDKIKDGIASFEAPRHPEFDYRRIDSDETLLYTHLERLIGPLADNEYALITLEEAK